VKALWIAYLLALPALLGGCGQPGSGSGGHDRRTALVSCSAAAIVAARHDARVLRFALRRVEACMADQRLPGYAIYDDRSQAVRYAYEDDRPVLRF
jgi:hypothetical protein